MATTGSTAKRTPVDTFLWILGTIVVVLYAAILMLRSALNPATLPETMPPTDAIDPARR